jgi:hypothetical protein
VIDSINPSAIVVTLYALGGGVARSPSLCRRRDLRAYLLLGVMLMLGSSLLPSLGDALRGRTGFILRILSGWCSGLQPAASTNRGHRQWSRVARRLHIRHS